MTQALVRQQSPEEREYARYLAEIEIRKRRVAEMQTELADFRETLGRFNAEYHARVGVLFVELDKLELAIAEYEFRITQLMTNPHTTPENLEQQTRQQFTAQREQIHEDEEETRYHQEAYREEQRRPQLDEESEASLKALFRELARRFHPDLAKTEDERRQREGIMKRVNAAFHERDIDALRAIGAEHEVDDAAFQAKPIGEKLVWAIREISRLDQLIETLGAERAALEASELAMLWNRHQSGENVVGHLEAGLTMKIADMRERLQSLIVEFRALTEQAYRG